MARRWINGMAVSNSVNFVYIRAYRVGIANVNVET